MRQFVRRLLLALEQRRGGVIELGRLWLLVVGLLLLLLLLLLANRLGGRRSRSHLIVGQGVQLAGNHTVRREGQLLLAHVAQNIACGCC